jgi:hypothetical protein
MIPVILGALAVGTGVAVYRKHKKGAMTPQRKQVFEAAVKSLKDPVKLRTLADSFEKEGLKAEAVILRKRANIFSASPEVVAQKKAVFKAAMKSSKPEAVSKVAQEFHKQGHFEVANQLRNYAKGLLKFNVRSA